MQLRYATPDIASLPAGERTTANADYVRYGELAVFYAESIFKRGHDDGGWLSMIEGIALKNAFFINSDEFPESEYDSDFIRFLRDRGLRTGSR